MPCFNGTGHEPGFSQSKGLGLKIFHLFGSFLTDFIMPQRIKKSKRIHMRIHIFLFILASSWN